MILNSKAEPKLPYEPPHVVSETLEVSALLVQMTNLGNDFGDFRRPPDEEDG